MAKIIVKSSEATNTPEALTHGEIAYSFQSDTLFIGAPGTTVRAIAGPGLFAKLVSPTFSGSPTAPTRTRGDDSTKLATTAFVKAQGYIIGNETITFTGDVTGSGKTAIALTLANSGIVAGTHTKVTFNAKGIATGGGALDVADIPALTAAKISDFDTGVRTSRLDQMAAPTNNIDMGGNRFIGSTAGINANDLVTKSQLDSAVHGLSWREPVDETATSPSPDRIGNNGFRVLIKGVGTGAFAGHNHAIATWNDGSNSWSFEAAGTNWTVINKDGDTQYTFDADTTAWILSASSKSYYSGNGLTKRARVFSVGAGAGIAVSATAVAIDPAWKGQVALRKFGGRDTSLDPDGTMYKIVSGALVIAAEGTDYLSAGSTIDGGTF